MSTRSSARLELSATFNNVSNPFVSIKLAANLIICCWVNGTVAAPLINEMPAELLTDLKSCVNKKSSLFSNSKGETGAGVMSSLNRNSAEGTTPLTSTGNAVVNDNNERKMRNGK